MASINHPLPQRVQGSIQSLYEPAGITIVSRPDHYNKDDFRRYGLLKDTTSLRNEEAKLSSLPATEQHSSHRSNYPSTTHCRSKIYQPSDEDSLYPSIDYIPLDPSEGPLRNHLGSMSVDTRSLHGQERLSMLESTKRSFNLDAHHNSSCQGSHVNSLSRTAEPSLDHNQHNQSIGFPIQNNTGDVSSKVVTPNRSALQFPTQRSPFEYAYDASGNDDLNKRAPDLRNNHLSQQSNGGNISITSITGKTPSNTAGVQAMDDEGDVTMEMGTPNDYIGKHHAFSQTSRMPNFATSMYPDRGHDEVKAHNASSNQSGPMPRGELNSSGLASHQYQQHSQERPQSENLSSGNLQQLHHPSYVDQQRYQNRGHLQSQDTLNEYHLLKQRDPADRHSGQNEGYLPNQGDLLNQQSFPRVVGQNHDQEFHSQSYLPNWSNSTNQQQERLQLSQSGLQNQSTLQGRLFPLNQGQGSRLSRNNATNEQRPQGVNLPLHHSDQQDLPMYRRQERPGFEMEHQERHHLVSRGSDNRQLYQERSFPPNSNNFPNPQMKQKQLAGQSYERASEHVSNQGGLKREEFSSSSNGYPNQPPQMQGGYHQIHGGTSQNVYDNPLLHQNTVHVGQQGFPQQGFAAQMPLGQARPHIGVRPTDGPSSMQLTDGGQKKKKVFILHFGKTSDDIDQNPILNLAVCLRRFEVDVTVDLFEYDNPPNSWALWYEQKINASDVVLCVITENFYQQLTNSNHVLGYSVYNLMNSSRNIAFRAVFLDIPKNLEYVPPAMRGATCYCVSSNRLTPNDEEFANLYAFLTGQNRVEKPTLGKMIVLAPKRSRFGQFSGRPAAPATRTGYPQQPQQHQQHLHNPAPVKAPPLAPAHEMPDVDQANFIFTLLGGEAAPVKSLRSHNKMFMQLSNKLTAEWEPLGRMLGVKEADLYAIKADNIHSVKEQAVQMFQHWLKGNGSNATLGALVTAVYDAGAHYWNLLDVISKYAPQQ